MKFSKIITFIVLFTNIFSEDCWNFNGEYPCQGDQKEYPPSWDDRSFQTPPRDDTLGNYREI